MRKYLCMIVILLTFLHMSQLHILADNYHKNNETANTVNELQQQIRQAVMQLKTDFDIRYTGTTVLAKDELTALIKEAITDQYIYANIASLSWHYSGYINNVGIKFQFAYHHSKEEEAFVDHTLNNIIEPMRRLSDFEKVKAAHDFIVLSTAYSSETVNSQYSPYTLLTENKGVCQAYALVLYRMLEKLGLEVRYVAGNAKEQLHAWVLVNLGGAWYHIDATWDDPVPDKQNEVRYNYFLLSDEQLAEDHEWDRTQYPVANQEYSLPTTSENAALHDLMFYVNAKRLSRLNGFPNHRTKFLTVVKNTMYDDRFSKVAQPVNINEESMGAKFLAVMLPMHFVFERMKIAHLMSNQQYKSMHILQQRISHKQRVVIKKGVPNVTIRDTLFQL